MSELDVNPIDVLVSLTKTKDSKLKELFCSMKREAKLEWFDTKEQLIEYYSNNENKLIEFKKLNVWWIAKVYSDKNMLKTLHDNIVFEIEKYQSKVAQENSIWHQLKDINLKIWILS